MLSFNKCYFGLALTLVGLKSAGCRKNANNALNYLSKSVSLMLLVCHWPELKEQFNT